MTFSCKNCEGKQKLPEQLQRNATLEEERGVRRGEQRQSEGEEEKRERESWGQAGCGTSKLWLTSTCSSQATRQARAEATLGDVAFCAALFCFFPASFHLFSLSLSLLIFSISWLSCEVGPRAWNFHKWLPALVLSSHFISLWQTPTPCPPSLPRSLSLPSAAIPCRPCLRPRPFCTFLCLCLVSLCRLCWAPKCILEHAHLTGPAWVPSCCWGSWATQRRRCYPQDALHPYAQPLPPHTLRLPLCVPLRWYETLPHPSSSSATRRDATRSYLCGSSVIWLIQDRLTSSAAHRPSSACSLPANGVVHRPG